LWVAITNQSITLPSIKIYGINSLEKKKLTTKKLSKLSKLQQDYYVFLVNSGGQPFVYSWDVNTGNSHS
jgi:3-methyladenine DNA glycosylase AlkD